MDAGSPVGVLVSEDVPDDLKQLYLEPSQCTCHVLEDVSLIELGNGLTEFLHIQDDQKLASICQPSDNTDIRSVEKEDKCEDQDQAKSTSISEKYLSKCASFPSACKKSSLDVSKYEEREDDITAAVSVKPACPRSISLPGPSKLVSAMKGSREKQGTMPPTKLTVTWAPDVYDPLPSASTSVRNKQPRSKSVSKKNYDCKKNGKNKQKGKPSRGGGSKDKKQVRKHGSSSNKCFQSLGVVDNRVVGCCSEPCGDLADFNVGSPDSYCGSSFLKKSVTKLHFSIAEAT